MVEILGTRALKNINGSKLNCSPNQPNSCPGGAMCYEDSLYKTFWCCGKDPSKNFNKFLNKIIR